MKKLHRYKINETYLYGFSDHTPAKLYSYNAFPIVTKGLKPRSTFAVARFMS